MRNCVVVQTHFYSPTVISPGAFESPQGSFLVPLPVAPQSPLSSNPFRQCCSLLSLLLRSIPDLFLPASFSSSMTRWADYYGRICVFDTSNVPLTKVAAPVGKKYTPSVFDLEIACFETGKLGTNISCTE